jgi:uncharacterized protein (DUF1330 family)
MPAYIIARVDVTNPTQYAQYTARTPRVVAHFGGRFIVRGAATATLEGADETRRVVVIEFPTLEQAQAFYASEQYQVVKALRAGAADGQFLLFDGYPEASWAEAVRTSQALPAD